MFLNARLTVAFKRKEKKKKPSTVNDLESSQFEDNPDFNKES